MHSRRLIALGLSLIFCGFLWLHLRTPATPAVNHASTPSAATTAQPHPRDELAAILAIANDTERLAALKAWLATLDPSLYPQVAAWLAAQPLSRNIDNELGLLMWLWGKTDGPAALTFLSEHYPRGTGLLTPAYAALAAWASVNPTAMTAYVDAHPDALRAWKATLIQGAAVALSDLDPTAARTWASQPRPLRYLALETVASSVSPDNYPAIATDLAKISAENPRDTFDAASSLSLKYAQTAPLEAITWALDTLPPGNSRSRALELGLTTAAVNSPLETAKLFADPAFIEKLLATPVLGNTTQEQTPDARYDYWLSQLVKGLVDSASPELALPIIEIVQDSELRLDLARRYYHGLDNGTVTPAWITEQAQAFLQRFPTPTSAPPTPTLADRHITALNDPANSSLHLLLPQADGTQTRLTPDAVAQQRNYHYNLELPAPTTVRLLNETGDPSNVVIFPAREGLKVEQDGRYAVFEIRPNQNLEVRVGGGQLIRITAAPPAPTE